MGRAVDHPRPNRVATNAPPEALGRLFGRWSRSSPPPLPPMSSPVSPPSWPTPRFHGTSRRFRASKPAWKEKPNWYLATEDHMIPVDETKRSLRPQRRSGAARSIDNENLGVPPPAGEGADDVFADVRACGYRHEGKTPVPAKLSATSSVHCPRLSSLSRQVQGAFPIQRHPRNRRTLGASEQHGHATLEIARGHIRLQSNAEAVEVMVSDSPRRSPCRELA